MVGSACTSRNAPINKVAPRPTVSLIVLASTHCHQILHERRVVVYCIVVVDISMHLLVRFYLRREFGQFPHADDDPLLGLARRVPATRL